MELRQKQVLRTAPSLPEQGSVLRLFQHPLAILPLAEALGVTTVEPAQTPLLDSRHLAPVLIMHRGHINKVDRFPGKRTLRAILGGYVGRAANLVEAWRYRLAGLQ
jgi:hypothetical protein